MEKIDLKFIDKCPVCRKKRYGKRNKKFHHIIKTICINPECNFKVKQTYHIDDYISENDILIWC